jgi:hypothetical protein
MPGTQHWPERRDRHDLPRSSALFCRAAVAPRMSTRSTASEARPRWWSTRIHLMRTGHLETDLRVLRAPLSYVPDLIAAKREAEHGTPPEIAGRHLAADVPRLRAELETARDAAPLPEHVDPAALNALHHLVVRTRRSPPTTFARVDALMPPKRRTTSRGGSPYPGGYPEPAVTAVSLRPRPAATWLTSAAVRFAVLCRGLRDIGTVRAQRGSPNQVDSASRSDVALGVSSAAQAT